MAALRRPPPGPKGARAQASRRRRRASVASAGIAAVAGVAVGGSAALGAYRTFVPSPGELPQRRRPSASAAGSSLRGSTPLQPLASSERYSRWSDLAARARGGATEPTVLERLWQGTDEKKEKANSANGLPRKVEAAAGEKEPGNIASTQATVLFAVSAVASALIAVATLATSSTLSSQPVGPAIKSRQEQVFEQWYSRAAEASKKATRLALKAQTTIEENIAEKPATGPTLVAPSIVERIRGVGQILDTCQQDIYDEVWAGLGSYPKVLDGYIGLMGSFTDTAYPADSKGPEVEQLRFALKYEVGRFARGLVAFDAAVEQRNIRDLERAFADVSLAYDRYLKAGNLYEGYDPITSTTIFYDNIDDSQLVYTPITLEQPRIRDEVLVIQGPDKGKVGRVIWLGRNGPDSKEPDKVVTATVKLDPNPMLGGNNGKGFSEVKAYPYPWIAVTRTSQQSFQLDLILGTLAALFSCGLTYPLDSLKSRIQSGLPLLPPEGLPGLFNGLTFNLLREVPNQGLYMAGFNFLTRQFCLLPFIDANNPSLKLLVMIPAGVLGFLSGSFIRAPFEVLNRQIQTGEAKTNQEAIENVFTKQPPEKVWQTLQKSWILCVVKGVPFGALQCTFYEAFKDRLELIQYGVPISLQPFIWGALAGALTGVITNPPDVVLANVSKASGAKDEAASPALATVAPGGSSSTHDATAPLGIDDASSSKKKGDDILGELWGATVKISQEEGPEGFFKGAGARALYFAPEACLWFAAYEFLRTFADTVSEL